jgi:hypothetical protein
MWPDVWARAVSEGEGRKEGTASGFSRAGCGLLAVLGRKGSLRPSFIFIFFFLFFFSVFLFLSQILYKFFKQCQTNFKSFIKFKTTSQNSNNHVFLIK